MRLTYRLYRFPAILICLFAIVACGQRRVITPSNNYVTLKVETERFHAIETSSSVDVIYSQTSGKQDIEIYAPDNVIEYIDVHVRQGVLKVDVKSVSGGLSFRGKCIKEVRVSAPAVNSLRASSSGDIIVKGHLKSEGLISLQAESSGAVKGESISCDELSIESSSSGDILLDEALCSALSVQASSSGDVSVRRVKAGTITAEASSAGDITLEGSCQTAHLQASSSGDIEAKELKAVEVTAHAEEAGDITCYASGRLNAKASTAGEVSYWGNPSQTEISSAGGVEKKD